MLDTPTETPTPAEAEAQIKLRELTAQSWNLELLISGAALFATLSLPDLLDSALTYYRYNLMADTDLLHDMLPTQALGLMKGVSYVLFVAFLVNFIMRAFWIGLVGLLAVYPDGIHYDQIYNLSQYARQRFAREMGTLPDYIMRLDRRCNVIFALAFGLALLLLGIAAAYGLFILVVTLLQALLPSAVYEAVRQAVGLFLIVGFTVLAVTITVLNLPSLRENPRLAPLAFRLSQGFSLLFLGLYRPLLYIMYTFYSQIPKPVLQRRLVIVITIFAVAEFSFILVQTLQTLGIANRLDSRSFMSLRDSSRTTNANAFDNLRPVDALIDKASLQADVIREPYVRLFISYPKRLDAELIKRYREPDWPDSLSRQVRRELRAAWYVKAFQAYFSVYVNDSLYHAPDLLFTQRADNDQRGLMTVLLPTNLKVGKNVLRLTLPKPTNKSVPGPAETYCLIPFWYVPEQ